MSISFIPKEMSDTPSLVGIFRSILFCLLAGAFAFSGVHSHAFENNCSPDFQSHACMDSGGCVSHSHTSKNKSQSTSSGDSSDPGHLHFCSNCTFFAPKTSELKFSERVIVVSYNYESRSTATGFQLSLFRPPRS